MKKTFKEKYLELKKENEYLHIILNDKVSNYRALDFEFNKFKNDLKVDKEKENKSLLICFLIGMLIAGICSILSLFLG